MNLLKLLFEFIFKLLSHIYIFLSKLFISILIFIRETKRDFKNVKSHSLLGISYYENAIKTIKTKTDNPIFHIYTNDMKFAKKIFKNLKLNNKIFFVNSENFNDIEEFCLYSQYKFSIIANSTFSLMSSFLSNKRIISIGPKNNWEHNSELKKEKRFKKLILV